MKLDFITKKYFFIFSVLATVIFLFLVFLGTTTCYRNELCRFLRGNILHDSLFFTIIFPGFLIISLITYPLFDSVFSRWKKFAVWAAPVVVVLSLVISNIHTSSSITGAPGETLIGLALALLYAWFFIHSLVLIVITAIREQRKKQAQSGVGTQMR